MKQSCQPIQTALVGLNFGAGLADCQIFNGAGGEFIRIVAVCDRNLAKARKYAAVHEGIRIYGDLSDVLKDSSIEAVMLMIPPTGRSAAVRECLAAGTHVLTTKPFDLDADAALTVLHEARERKLVVHLNSPGPLPSCDLAQIRRWRKDFNLGKPVAGHWETYAEYHETADGSWFDSPEKCPVAPIFRIGIYGINEMVAVFGEPEDAEVISGRIATGRPTPDNAQLLLRFADGAIGSIYSALCIGDGRLYPSALTLHFEHGTIYKTQVRTVADRDFTGVSMRLETLRGGRLHVESAELPAAERSGSYQYENFYRAVRNGPLPDEVSPETIVAGIKAIALMMRKDSAK